MSRILVQVDGHSIFGLPDLPVLQGGLVPQDIAEPQDRVVGDPIELAMAVPQKALDPTHEIADLVLPGQSPLRRKRLKTREIGSIFFRYALAVFICRPPSVRRPALPEGLAECEYLIAIVITPVQ